MIVTRAERIYANSIAREIAGYERTGVIAGARIGFRAQRTAIAAWRSRTGNPALVFVDELEDAIPLLRDAMVLAHLAGMMRVQTALPPSVQLSLDVYQEATANLAKRLELNEQTVSNISAVYAVEAEAVLKRTGIAVSRNIHRAMFDIQVAGEHVREARKSLALAFEKSGLTPRNSYTLENIFRTQTQMAYSAGRYNQNQDPAIDEILWGYKYVTVGDVRVRPEHRGLDGTILPKNHPLWNTIFPPNGYGCRCTVIEIFDEGEASLPPDTFTTEVNGRDVTVVPGADKGFNFHPGKVFRPIAA